MRTRALRERKDGQGEAGIGGRVRAQLGSPCGPERLEDQRPGGADTRVGRNVQLSGSNKGARGTGRGGVGEGPKGNIRKGWAGERVSEAAVGYVMKGGRHEKGSNGVGGEVYRKRAARDHRAEGLWGKRIVRGKGGKGNSSQAAHKQKRRVSGICTVQRREEGGACDHGAVHDEAGRKVGDGGAQNKEGRAKDKAAEAPRANGSPGKSGGCVKEVARREWGGAGGNRAARAQERGALGNGDKGVVRGEAIVHGEEGGESAATGSRKQEHKGEEREAVSRWRDAMNHLGETERKTKMREIDCRGSGRNWRGN